MMKSTDKYKVCSNCEGRIPLEVVICPYCAANVSQQEASRVSSPKPITSNTSSESLAGLYNPPYASRLLPTSEEKKKSLEESLKVEPKAAVADKMESNEKSEILPISLLVVGSNLMLFGLLQLLLSKDGLLSLEWNSRFWYAYSLLALPLLWLGVKSLRKA